MIDAPKPPPIRHIRNDEGLLPAIAAVLGLLVVFVVYLVGLLIIALLIGVMS